MNNFFDPLNEVESFRAFDDAVTTGTWADGRPIDPDLLHKMKMRHFLMVEASPSRRAERKERIPPTNEIVEMDAHDWA